MRNVHLRGRIMLRIVSTFLVSAFLASPVLAQPALSEPPEFPPNMPGPSFGHPGTDCFWLASGAIEPGDVDWIQVSVPFASLQTIVDVDFSLDAGGSVLLVSVAGGPPGDNEDDNNHAVDGCCGLGADTTPPGSPQDSAVDLGETLSGAVINIGISGTGDSGFTGDHAESFVYDVWVYAVRDGGCSSDADCDDGLFCNGQETCDATHDCQPGLPPCLPGEICSEEHGCQPGVAPALDIKPGSCPNPFNRDSRGVLPVALLGTGDFDVTLVDVSTIRLSRAGSEGGDVAPNEGPPGPHSEFDDVGTPFGGEPCECHDLADDGITDLAMKFKVPDVVSNLELGEFASGHSVELMLTGALLDGTTFAATDCIRLVPKRGTRLLKRAK